MKGGEKVEKEWEKSEESEKTFLQHYIYVRV